MASLVLSAAGNYFGGPIGAYIGSYVGGMIDQKIFGKSAPDIEGARLSDLKVQVSTYGNMLPITYGTTRLAGNIIWATPLQETKHSEDAGGKGGGGQEINSYTYSVNFAVALTEGKIEGIRRIWANGNLIYDRSDTVSNNNVKVLVYTGTETQLPDPLMQAYLGAGNVPAYRGTAYAVFENLQLEKFGNRIPNLSFEVVNNGADYLLPIVSSTANNGFVLAKYAHVNQSPLFYAWRTTQLDVFVHLNEIAIYNTTTNTYDIFYSSTDGYAINDILYVDYVLNDLGLPIQLEQIWVVGPQEFYGGVGIIIISHLG